MSKETPHILIVEGRFYDDIADALVEGAVAALEKAGATHDRWDVPGALEIPAAINFAIEGCANGTIAERFDGYVALGCVIRGETTHYDYVCSESARGLMDLALKRNAAIANGILTVENRDQAWARAAVDGKNKGGAVAEACLAMVNYKSLCGID
jgi:6,7-dimethyl-8-ribityllumazine synthase